MASEPALAFYLDGPMQSWGASSRFQHRKTESFPTKSGVLGLLAAALGIDKHAPDEAERLAPLAALQFSVFAVVNSEKPREIVRLVDFHTVGGGYDRNDPVERLHITTKASGGPSTTVITHRTYLTDARFIAVLSGDPTLLQTCAAALEDPKWGVWFGRKSCLPAAPLSPVLADSPSEAVAAVLEKLNSQTKLAVSHGQEQSEGDGTWFQSDQPVSFGKREFRSRPVKRICKSSDPAPS
jgi:CRISPR system Cascade subunit CasD